MDNIIEPNDTFDFSSISLAHPTGIQGGAYFTKIQYNDKPLYIQTPKGLTKQGFIKNGKKIYADLMFDNNSDQFIHWLENLETKCQELIFAKGDVWFENPLEKNDIETAFASPMRIYKSGKYYLVRVNIKVNSVTNVPNIKIYDENEKALALEDIKNETKLISIIEIQGIKFTSRNFQIEIELKQIMTMNTEVLFENCLIKKTNKKDTTELHVPPITTPIIDSTVVKKELVTTSTIPEKSLSENTLRNTNINSSAIPLIVEQTKHDDDNDEEESDSGSEYTEEDENGSISNNKPPIKLGTEINPSLKKKTSSSIPDLEEFDFNFADLEKEKEPDNDLLKEFDLFDNLDSLESMTLKKPNQVYYEIYKQARKKAKQAKKDAIVAFLEAKNIKKTYLLDDLDESDDDEADLENWE